MTWGQRWLLKPSGMERRAGTPGGVSPRALLAMNVLAGRRHDDNNSLKKYVNKYVKAMFVQ